MIKLSVKGVVYHLVPTSNHNLYVVCHTPNLVVYHLVPTSNHNLVVWIRLRDRLFIILFLHQTTTQIIGLTICRSCLSSCSYIKPQLRYRIHTRYESCLSSCSYIKPQLADCYTAWSLSCLSSCSYIKPQPRCRT